MKRKIVKIEEEKCDGCGLCIPQCAEGAIQLIDGKARLVADKYCDGLGACLGHCPQGAITVEEKEAEEFNETAVKERLERLAESEGTIKETGSKSRLSQWPIQLKLVSPHAPYFQDAELLFCADCVPFAYPDFHEDLLRGKIILIGCPKLDDAEFYREKLTQILSDNNIKNITVAHMEVPCCFGLNHIVGESVKASGKDISIREVTIGVKGGRISP